MKASHLGEKSAPKTNWKRNFYTMTAGQAVSLIGSSAVQFSLIWWLTSVTNSPMVLSIAGLVAMLPMMLLGPFAGVWVDRMKRKSVMIAADLFMGAAAAIFALLFIGGTPPHWAAYVVLGLRGLGEVFHSPAIQAAVPMLVPQEELVRANSVSQFLQSGSFMLGPVLGAAMFAALPLPVIMLTDVLGAAIASVTVAVIPIPDPEKTQRQTPQFFREMKEGVKVIVRDKPLAVLTLASTLCMVFYMPLSSLYPLLTTAMNGTAWHAGAIELAYAAGMLACTGLVSLHGDIKNKFRAIHIALVALGLTCFACSVFPNKISWFVAYAVACALMGASGSFYNIPFVAHMQQTIPPEAQGRAFSLLSSLMSFAMPVGLLLAGPAAEARGVHFWFFVSGIAIVAIAILSRIITMRLTRGKNTRTI